MSNRIVTVSHLLLISVAFVSAAGCNRTAAVAAGAAGAAAAVVANDQNAEAEIAGSVADVDRRARAVLASMNLMIGQSSTENAGAEREYEARSGDRVVHVKIERRSDTVSKVSVSSRMGTTVNYDVSHARMIVGRIEQQR